MSTVTLRFRSYVTKDAPVVRNQARPHAHLLPFSSRLSNRRSAIGAASAAWVLHIAALSLVTIAPQPIQPLDSSIPLTITLAAPPEPAPTSRAVNPQSGKARIVPAPRPQPKTRAAAPPAPDKARRLPSPDAKSAAPTPNAQLIPKSAAGVSVSTRSSLSAPRFDAAYLNNPAPAYPSLSRRLGEEGRAVLRVFVAPDGRPREVHLQISSGYSRLDHAAQQSVAQWRFLPARRGQEAVGAWVLVPVSFNLADG